MTSQRGGSGKMESSVGATSWSSGTIAAVQESSDLVGLTNNPAVVARHPVYTFWYKDVQGCSTVVFPTSSNGFLDVSVLAGKKKNPHLRRSWQAFAGTVEQESSDLAELETQGRVQLETAVCIYPI